MHVECYFTTCSAHENSILLSCSLHKQIATVCPDEINHEHGDITDLFIENIGGGKVFHLGGLAGVP
jgi:hypothetical protein